jgi:PAP2 superfamily protein
VCELSIFPLLSIFAVSAVGTMPAPTTGEVVHWNRVMTDATAASTTSGDPVTESRIFAIVHVAMHDAVNSIEPRFERYRATMPIANGASTDAAIASAAHDALSELVPSGRSAFDAALRETLDAIPAGAAKIDGIEVGRRAAAAILAARQEDGSTTKIARKPGTKPGEYRPTPPDFTPAWMAQWGDVLPFVLQSSSQFRPAAPPAPGSPEALRDINEIRSIGAAEGSTRTDEQSEIARFWYENSTQGWNRIAREVSASRHLDVADDARLFALLNLAMADGFISGFEAKYHYAYWRPATAIRESGQSSWINYLPTPPVPDHPSTHTVLGAAAATVLSRFFETDCVAFSTTSGAPYPGITRHYWSFSEAARENGASRMLAGIHFRSAVNAGYRLGEDVGTWTFEHALRPSAAPVSAGSSVMRSPR